MHSDFWIWKVTQEFIKSLRNETQSLKFPSGLKKVVSGSVFDRKVNQRTKKLENSETGRQKNEVNEQDSLGRKSKTGSSTSMQHT